MELKNTENCMLCGEELEYLTAYKNQTGKDTDEEIKEAIRRGASVPGGYCGLFERTQQQGSLFQRS